VLVQRGERVSEGQPLLELRHRRGRGLDQAVALCRTGISIADEAPASRPKVLAEVR
jgi:thymidine phosphorylase